MTSINDNIFPTSSSTIQNEISSTRLSLIHPDLLPSIGNIIPGQFDYITNESDRLMLTNAWEAITLTETWDFIKNNQESFMFINNPLIKIISQTMFELGYDLHTEASFGCTMRVMKFIAINGDNKFKTLVLKEKLD